MYVSDPSVGEPVLLLTVDVEAPAFFRFRHYHNLAKTEEKLKKFITAFRHCRFLTCQQYLENVIQDECSR